MLLDVVKVSALVAVAALPVVFWLPAVLTPGKSISALPLKGTPPIFLVVVKVAALPFNVAVISPAEKLRLASLYTIVLAVLEDVAFDVTVNVPPGELTLPLIPLPLVAPCVT